MLSRIRMRRPTPAMVVALLALFVALSGTAVAAGIVPLAKRALLADNANKLQGKTPAALLQTAQQAAQQSAAKAAQAVAQLPGPASTAAALVVIKTSTWTNAPKQEQTYTVTCDSGQKATGGGWSDPGDWSSSYQTLPTPDDGGWMTTIYTPSGAPGAQSGTVYAVCLK